MNIAHPVPPPSTPLHPAALAMAADRQPPRPQPETERPAGGYAAPEVSSVAVLGYN